MAKLFALDHAFPVPIVEVLQDLFQQQAELVPIQEIDERMPDLEDWEVMLSLFRHPRAWDGLITTDVGMLSLPREMWVLMRTKLSLIVASAAGDDPIRATGLLFVHLLSVCNRTDPAKAQIWKLSASERLPIDPMQVVKRAAEHRNVSSGEFLAGGQLAPAVFAKNPLT